LPPCALVVLAVLVAAGVVVGKKVVPVGIIIEGNGTSWVWPVPLENGFFVRWDRF